MSKIVVPLDGTFEAEGVLPYAEELAKLLSLEIILVRIMPRYSISLLTVNLNIVKEMLMIVIRLYKGPIIYIV